MSSQAFTGWVRPEQSPTPSSSVDLNIVPVGAIDGVNRIFSFSTVFSEVALYLNGVRLLLNTDFVQLASPTGGYNRVELAVAPEGGATPDVLTADIVAD